MKARPFTRRKFLASAGLAAAGVAAYGHFIEPGWLNVRRHSLRLPNRKLAREVKILHLSDLHASSVVPLTLIQKAVQRSIELKPDLVILTGDFITDRFEAFAEYAKILSQLPAQCPTFATLGNHDGGDWVIHHGGYPDTAHVRELLAQSNVTLLHNRSVEFKTADSAVHLVGLGDAWAREFSPGAAFADVANSTEVPTLVLSHNPDTKDQLGAYPWDALFCGHTHGGQLLIPLVGTPFAPVQDKRFVEGLHPWKDRWIHITKGVGNLHGMRLNCRPEISLITLC